MISPVAGGFKTFSISSIKVPLFCVVCSQALQGYYCIDYRASGGGSLMTSPDLLFVSLVKVVTVVVLAIYVARQLLAGDHWRNRQELNTADRYLGYIIGVNIAFAMAMVAYISFINSEHFQTFSSLGITKKAAKLVLLLAAVAAVAPFNKSVFRDISKAIGSRAADGIDAEAMRTINKRFVVSITKKGNGLYAASIPNPCLSRRC